MGIDASAVIHPSAVVEQGARIGPGCTVGPFCTVGPEVTLAARVTLKSHVVVTGWTEVGRGQHDLSLRQHRRGAAGSEVFRRTHAVVIRQARPHPRRP